MSILSYTWSSFWGQINGEYEFCLQNLDGGKFDDEEQEAYSRPSHYEVRRRRQAPDVVETLDQLGLTSLGRVAGGGSCLPPLDRSFPPLSPNQAGDLLEVIEDRAGVRAPP